MIKLAVTNDVPDHSSDPELRQIFIEAVRHAFRSEIFEEKTNLTGEDAREEYARQIFREIADDNNDKVFYARILRTENPFVTSVLTHWNMFVLELEVAGYADSVHDAAISIANQALSAAHKESPALALVKN